jgi:hypothetical protein
MQVNNTNVISTKPHMIKLKNLEYEAHQKNMMRLMVRTTNGFGQSKEPMVRRKERFLVYGKQVLQNKIDYENEILMQKIVRISASDPGMVAGGIHQKKSMLEKQMRAEGRRIDSENKKLSLRIFNQLASNLYQDF